MLEFSSISVIVQYHRQQFERKMVKYIVIAIVALVAFQGVVAKPKGKKAQAAAQEPNQLEQFVTDTQNLVQNVSHTLGLDNLPDSQKVVDDLKTNAQNLANKFQEVVEKLKNEVDAHKPEVDNVVKQVQQQLTATANQLQQAAGPEATAKAKELRDTVDQGLKNAVAQVEKLVKAVEPDATKAKTDIENAAKKLLDQIVDVSQNIQTQVKSAIEEHEKTHKN